ncbi:MAG TPA: hypothetical protein VI193_05500 [Acidimicrobiia bacterium]
MSELFQCDYCGRLRPLNDAVLAWAEDADRETKDGDSVFTVEVTCGPSCAEKVNAIRVRR